jgi:hypothetical protein
VLCITWPNSQVKIYIIASKYCLYYKKQKKIK